MFNFQLSDESKKKWRAFKNKKSAYYSTLILVFLFISTLFAEYYANSRPFIVKYDGAYFFPLFKEYTEEQFGGFLETEPNYHDNFIKEEFAKEGNWAIFPPIPWDYKDINFNPNLQHPSPPTQLNWLGTDNRGRDVFSRLIYGFRVSLLFGLALALVDALLGIFMGSIQGYFGGWTDIICQRLIEIWSSIPFLYALILIASIFTPNFILLIVILSLFGWIAPQSLVRIEFLKSRNKEYVTAARALGVTNFQIMVKHILPNALTMVITRLPFSITGGMTALVSLDFLGLGVPSPAPSLGESLNQGLANIDAWWIGLSTVSVLLLLLILITFIGEAILDVFDPNRA